jgi:hypothetical protein
MKLTRAAETIIAEDNGASFRKCISELENDKGMLQHNVDLGIEDYNLLVAGKKKLVSERDELKHLCTDLQAELVRVCSDAQNRIDDLEAKVKSAKAHSIEVVADGEKRWKEFEDGLIQKFGELCKLYTGNVQVIGGL